MSVVPGLLQGREGFVDGGDRGLEVILVGHVQPVGCVALALHLRLRPVIEIAVYFQNENIIDQGPYLQASRLQKPAIRRQVVSDAQNHLTICPNHLLATFGRKES